MARPCHSPFVLPVMADFFSQRIAELEAENAVLRAREEDLADFVENGAVPLHWVAADGTISWANRAELELLGYTKEEYIGHHVAEFHVDREVIDDILRLLAAGETIHDYEARLRHKNGSICHVVITSSVRWNQERFLHTRCFTRDVTDRKRIETELRSAVAQFQLITESMPAAVARCGRDLRYVWVSPGYALWLGRLADQIVGHRISDAIGERGFDDIRPYIERVLSGERVEYTTQVRFIGPGERWIHAVYAPTCSAEGAVDGWVAVVSDITERRAMELANAHLASIIESSEDAIISKDLDGNILSWNSGAERIYGYSSPEAIGQNMLLLLPPDRQQEEADILTRLRRGESVAHFETTRLTKAGTSINVSLTISPIRDVAGRIIGISHIARDITERKQVERQLQQSQRLESLGVLAGGIAHDFNNLLTGILGNTSLALESMSSNHPARQTLRTAMTASDRAADLTKQLLAYAGKGRFLIEPISLSAMIREIGELLQSSIPRTVQLRLDLAEVPYIETSRPIRANCSSSL